MARRNRFLGRWLAHGEGYPDWNVRLFDRRRARWTDDPVHEHVVADGPVARLAGDLLHASAESLDAYMAKQNRYTTLQAEAMHARGERAGAARTRAVAARALRPLLRRQAGIPRRRPRPRPHRDRLLQQLHEIRQVARAWRSRRRASARDESRCRSPGTARAGHRRRRVHRHAHRGAPARGRRARHRRRQLRSLLRRRAEEGAHRAPRPAAGIPVRAPRPRRRAGAAAPCSRRRVSAASSTSPRSPACATRSSIPRRTSPTT